MAEATRVCATCGRQLQAGDKFCASCGTPAVPVTTQQKSTGQMAPVTCEVCGHRNSHDGVYCESCGVKLPGRKVIASGAKKQGAHSKPAASSGLQPWHYLAGAFLLGIVVTFIYLELTRPTETDPQTAMNAQTPPASVSPAAPAKELLQAIEHFQHLVDENPNDSGSKLKLANSLHDASTHDPKFLPRAIEAYKAYLKQMPGDPNARVDLGICYFEMGKLDSTRAASLFAMAINEMETAAKGAPNHQPAAFNLGIVNLYAGNLQASNTWLKKAMELNPNSDLGRRAKSIVEQHIQAE